jgi:hypothetical protein
MTTVVYILYIFAVCLYVIIARASQSDIFTAVSENPAAMYLVMASFTFGWCVCGLASYHCFLISAGLTTNEEHKLKRHNDRHPNHHHEIQVSEEDRARAEADCGTRFQMALCTQPPPAEIHLLRPVVEPTLSQAAMEWLSKEHATSSSTAAAAAPADTAINMS